MSITHIHQQVAAHGQVCWIFQCIWSTVWTISMCRYKAPDPPSHQNKTFCRTMLDWKHTHLSTISFFHGNDTSTLYSGHGVRENMKPELPKTTVLLCHEVSTFIYLFKYIWLVDSQEKKHTHLVWPAFKYLAWKLLLPCFALANVM